MKWTKKTEKFWGFFENKINLASNVQKPENFQSTQGNFKTKVCDQI